MQGQKIDFSSIRIIHGSLCLGVIMFGMVCNFILVQHDKASTAFAGNELMLAVVAAIGVGGLFVGQLVYKSMISKARAKEGLQPKFMAYLQGSIVKYALLEGPTLVGLVMYMTTYNYLFLYLALAFLAALVLSFPSKGRFVMDLELGMHEREELESF